MLEKLKSLNSECFLYENYESNWWSVFDLSFEESLESNRVSDCIEKYGIGYCDGSQVTVRPRVNTYAVMFEREGEKFWFHLDSWQVDNSKSI